MSRIKLIGTGACGNKIAAEIIKRGILNSEDVLMINSTLKDIPQEFKNSSVQLKSEMTIGGCCKEPDKGEALTFDAIDSGQLRCLDELLDADTNQLYIVASTGGGTGSGSAPVIANYMKDDVHIHIVAITGFLEDMREIENLIRFFNLMDKDYTIEIISNKKFLDLAKGNKIKAEQMANEEVCNRLKVLSGAIIRESDQNIDEMDLLKTVTMPGYLIQETVTLDKIKNVDQFNKAVQDVIDNSKSLDISTKGGAITSIILDVKDATLDNIDQSFDVIKENYGVSYEVYKHIQNSGSQEYMSFIISGMKMPMDDIKELLNKYNKDKATINTEDDSFFDQKMQIDSPNKFNLKQTTKKITSEEKRLRFLEKHKNTLSKQVPGFSNVKINDNIDNY